MGKTKGGKRQQRTKTDLTQNKIKPLTHDLILSTTKVLLTAFTRKQLKDGAWYKPPMSQLKPCLPLSNSHGRLMSTLPVQRQQIQMYDASNGIWFPHNMAASCKGREEKSLSILARKPSLYKRGLKRYRSPIIRQQNTVTHIRLSHNQEYLPSTMLGTKLKHLQAADDIAVMV